MKVVSLARQYRRARKAKEHAKAEMERRNDDMNAVYVQSLAAGITYHELLQEVELQDAEDEEYE